MRFWELLIINKLLNNKIMYSKELESIIEAALADGTLTDRERAVLHKRAMAEGVDIDELDVIIEGKLAKMKKEEDWLKPDLSVQKDIEKMGNIVKCPNCGASVIPGKTKCEECGHIFVNVGANKSSEKLAELLRKVDENKKSRRHEEAEKEKATIINTFPIPNTKVDLMDFMSMLIPLSSGRRNDEEKITGKAYYNKLKECVNKVNVTFPNDSDFNYLLKEYKKESIKLSTTQIIVGCYIIALIICSILMYLEDKGLI